MNIGDLVTLKGMSNAREKPLGIIMKKWATKHLEIFWLNEDMKKRYAVAKILLPAKIEIINSVHR